MMTLTPLDHAILSWLLRLPFLRLDDLSPLVGASRSATVRHLRALTGAKLVATVPIGQAMPYAAGACSAYFLTHAGIVGVAREMGADPVDLARAWKSDEAHLLRLLARLPDVIQVQIFMQTLIAGAPEVFGAQARGQWQWVREYRHLMRDQQQHVRVVQTDAAMTLQVQRPGQPLLCSSALIFTDHAFCDWGSIRQRLATVSAWRDGPEQRRMHAHFPPILVLATSERHIERWQRITVEVARQQMAAPLDILAIVWDRGLDPWRTPWRHLVSHATLRLAQILHDLPQQALLPDMVGRTGIQAASPATATPTRPIVLGRYVERAALRETSPPPPHPALVAWRLSRSAHRLLHQVALLPGVPVVDLGRFIDYEPLSVTRALRALAREGCVTVTEIPDVGPCVRLTEWGAQIVSLRSTTSRSSRHIRHALRVPVSGARHEAGVYHFCALLVEAAREQQEHDQDHEVVWWETAALSHMRYRMMEHWFNLAPDAAGVYRVGYRRMHWWLEWDNGTMDAAELATKFRAYARYIQTRQGHVRGERWLPMLLCVVPHYEQLERMRRVASETLPLDASFEAYITLAEQVEAVGPLGAIWRPLRQPAEPMPHHTEAMRHTTEAVPQRAIFVSERARDPP